MHVNKKDPASHQASGVASCLLEPYLYLLAPDFRSNFRSNFRLVLKRLRQLIEAATRTPPEPTQFAAPRAVLEDHHVAAALAESARHTMLGNGAAGRCTAFAKRVAHGASGEPSWNCGMSRPPWVAR